MDETKKPLLIPPEFALYAEKHEIFDLYQRMLSQLLVHKPEEPMQFLIDFIKKDKNAAEIVLIGPPASGKKTISRLLAKKTGALLITKNSLVENIPVSLKAEFAKKAKDAYQPNDWAKLIKARVDEYECVRKGWILEGFPETREQAMAMQSIGVMPKHSIILDTKDSVLIERAAGKRVDVKTGEVYHTTFEMPNDSSIKDRLQVPSSYTEAEIIDRLVVFRRHIGGVEDSLKVSAKIINADQPKGDLFSQALAFVSRPPRSIAPVTPRIILIGSVGSGRKTQAKALAKKYNIVEISVSDLVRQAISNDTTIGNACKPYFNKKTTIPDSLVIQLLRERLGQLDCVSKGWVLHSYPKNREQAEALDRAGFVPNKVFFFELPYDSIMERTTLKYIDPVTGENYHLLYNPPPSREIRERLHQHHSDKEESVRAKNGEYLASINDLQEYYEAKAINVNAEKNMSSVFEMLETGIVNTFRKDFIQ